MKNIGNWRHIEWQKYAMAILTIVVLLILASHPELRLLYPLVDALGVDVLLTLLSVQFISLYGDYVKPSLLLAYRNVLLPMFGKLHSLLLFLGGSFGHYLTVNFFHLHSKMFPNYAIKGTSV